MRTIRTDTYTKIIYSALLYRWTFPSREEHKLQVFDNKVFRKVSETKEDERNVRFRTYRGTMIYTSRLVLLGQ
jgi:hypothetical protein